MANGDDSSAKRPAAVIRTPPKPAVKVPAKTAVGAVTPAGDDVTAAGGEEWQQEEFRAAQLQLLDSVLEQAGWFLRYIQNEDEIKNK